MAVLLVSVLWAPDLLLLAFFAVIILLAIMEWAGMTGGLPRLAAAGLQLVFLAGGWLWLNLVPGGLTGMLAAIGLFWGYVTFTIMKIERSGELPKAPAAISTFTAGLVALTGALASAQIILQFRPADLGWLLPEIWLGIPFSRWLLLGVLLMVVCVDMGGYFVGRRWGTVPLAAVISPGKTVQGLLGAVLFGLTVPAITLSFLSWRQWLYWMCLASLLVILSLYGDLWESLRKRHSGVKDAGSLLSGHGGVLDRIDSYMIVLPIFALLIHARSSLPL